MFRVHVTDKNKNSWAMDFKTTAEASQWIEKIKLSGEYGLPERPEVDLEGKPTGVILPQEFTTRIEDISAEITAAKTKADALTAAQARIDALDVQAKLANATTVAGLRSALQEIVTDLVALRKR